MSAADRLIMEQCFQAGGHQTLETRYKYSDLGQLLTMEDFKIQNSQKIRYRYTAYTYDGLGQMTSAAEYSGSDVPDKKTLEKYRMEYSYDLDGRLAGIIYPSVRETQIQGIKYIYMMNMGGKRA